MIEKDKKKIRELEKELSDVYEEWGGLDNAPARELIEQIEREKGLNPEYIHEELSKRYGPYKSFRELTEEVYTKAARLDITGALKIICEHQNKMVHEGQQYYLPIINSLIKRLENLALECVGQTK